MQRRYKTLILKAILFVSTRARSQLNVILNVIGFYGALSRLKFVEINHEYIYTYILIGTDEVCLSINGVGAFASASQVSA